MQKHTLRDELWCFLFGRGRMKSDTNFRGRYLAKGNTLLIKKNTWHQYKAIKRTLVLEIQTGLKCEESDIERKNE